MVRLLHGALGAGAVGPVSAYFGQQGQTEQPMVTIGGLMEKVRYVLANRIFAAHTRCSDTVHAATACFSTFYSHVSRAYISQVMCGVNIQVYEAESAIDSGMDTHQSQSWEPTGTLEQMRKELRVSIESSVEKSVMEAQMNKSKVPQYPLDR